MYLAELKYGMVIIFTDKKQYGFEIEHELFTYNNFISLACSYEEALKNKDILIKIHPLLSKSKLCAGKTIQEINLESKVYNILHNLITDIKFKILKLMMIPI